MCLKVDNHAQRPSTDQVLFKIYKKASNFSNCFCYRSCCDPNGTSPYNHLKSEVQLQEIRGPGDIIAEGPLDIRYNELHGGAIHCFVREKDAIREKRHGSIIVKVIGKPEDWVASGRHGDTHSLNACYSKVTLTQEEWDKAMAQNERIRIS